jgi:nitroreductase
MRVSEALETRRTCRAFLPVPVPEATVRAILAGASRAPSGGNLQPWRVWALAGEDLRALERRVKDKIAGGAISEGQTEYNIYPPEMREPYAARHFAAGAQLYTALEIGRDDWAARKEQYVRHFDFFGAPVGLFFAIDRSMQQGQWADLGMFMQSVMLLAREHGLHTAPLEAWAFWHETVREVLRIPPELMFFCGMGLGRMDPDHPVNRYRTPRASVDEFATLRGFGTVQALSETMQPASSSASGAS